MCHIKLQSKRRRVMKIIKRMMVALIAMVTCVVVFSGYAQAEEDSVSKNASAEALICVKCYDNFNDLYYGNIYKTIYVPYGTSDVDKYLTAPEHEYLTFAKWRFYDVTNESFDVNEITGENIVVYGTWSEVVPVSADADTSIEDSEYAKLTCYIDYEAYKSGNSYKSINIMMGYNADGALEIPKRDNYIFEDWVYVDKNGAASNAVVMEDTSVYARWIGPVPTSGALENASVVASHDASGNPVIKITYYKSLEDYQNNIVYKEIYVSKSTYSSDAVEDPTQESYQFKYWNYVQGGRLVDSFAYDKNCQFCVRTQTDLMSGVSIDDVFHLHLSKYTDFNAYAKISTKTLKRKKKQLKLNIACKYTSKNVGDICEVCYWIKGKPKTKKTVKFSKNKNSNNTTVTLKKLKSKKKYCIKARVRASYKDVDYVSKWSKTVTCKTK